VDSVCTEDDGVATMVVVAAATTAVGEDHPMEDMVLLTTVVVVGDHPMEATALSTVANAVRTEAGVVTGRPMEDMIPITE